MPGQSNRPRYWRKITISPTTAVRVNEIAPSMREPVSVRNSFRSVLTLPERAASAAILLSALLDERFVAQCQLGVLVSVGAANCLSTSPPSIEWRVGPGVCRSHRLRRVCSWLPNLELPDFGFLGSALADLGTGITVMAVTDQNRSNAFNMK